MKKHFFLLLFVIAGALSSFAALTALHIHTASQGIVTILLEEEPEITFNDNRTMTVEIKADTETGNESQPITISFDDVKTCTYGDKDDYVETSVSPIAPDRSDICISFSGDNVVFSNIPDDTLVDVFTLDGAMVMQGFAKAGSFTIVRRSLEQGIYLVRIGDFATKLSL